MCVPAYAAPYRGRHANLPLPMLRLRSLNLLLSIAAFAPSALAQEPAAQAAPSAAPSRLTSLEPSAEQTRSLALLCRTWGFLKYHHPSIAQGFEQPVDWDAELLDILPRIAGAADLAACQAQLANWSVDYPVPAADPEREAKRPELTDVYMRAELDWLNDEVATGAALGQYLRGVHAGRPAKGEQRYVKLMPGVSNADFSGENPYAELDELDAGYRLLGLFRFWNIIQWWSPYRDLVDEDWFATLNEFIPRVLVAKTQADYEVELHALIARVKDTHTKLYSSRQHLPPTGELRLPVELRFIEGQALVTERLLEPSGEDDLLVGDVILAIDGRAVPELVEEFAPYHAASNHPTRLRGIAEFLTRGSQVAVPVRIERDGTERELRLERIPSSGLARRAARTNDRAGETFQMLDAAVAYCSVAEFEIDRAAEYIEAAQAAKGLIVDIRNYPQEFMVFALASRLVTERTPFAAFTRPHLAEPGTFIWSRGTRLGPQQPHYSGKVVILVDESTQSRAEYTAMALRASPNAIVVGSTTAGADGNVSMIKLPGNLVTAISGVGVFYPDRSPTQRIGIVPDVEVRPTIAGLRAGRDEVLEEAIRQILGAETPEERVRAIAAPPK